MPERPAEAKAAQAAVQMPTEGEREKQCVTCEKFIETENARHKCVHLHVLVICVLTINLISARCRMICTHQPP